MVFNDARDFKLQGQDGAPIGLLMYPYAETVEGTNDSLDLHHFAYAITSKEIA